MVYDMLNLQHFFGKLSLNSSGLESINLIITTIEIWRTGKPLKVFKILILGYVKMK